MPKAAAGWARQTAPEVALAVLAVAMFLGCLGSVDLWGKREQRASAEAIDTIARGHWLVAQIQGRPRLEKPPLPRWTIALLMELTGRRDEVMVRLPGAASALGMVALVYLLGRHLGGRSVGLAAALSLSSFGFFIAELRQAGNDGPLAFFTTLALYAAWRRLHADGAEGHPRPPAEVPGPRRWTLVMYAALGLGFLTKGPVILLLVALTVVPYLAMNRRLRPGLRALANGWGLLLLAILVLSWPLPVLLRDPTAARVWYLEMAQKAGSAGIKHHRQREVLAAQWPGMTLPWSIVATLGAIVPLTPRGRPSRPAALFPWCWGVLNLAMFCLWRVAKPNYFLPCLPGAALLTGLEWVRLCREARRADAGAVWARVALQAHWVILFVAAALAPVVVRGLAPEYAAWSAALAPIAALSVVACAWLWRRGADALAMAPIVAAMAVAVVAGYGWIAPAENASHSHRALAEALDRILPPGDRTVMFFHELDEGLWFYLRDRQLVPVPGSQPRYNDGFDLIVDYELNRLLRDPVARMNREKQVLLDWLDGDRRESPYLLIRTKDYDLFAPDLVGRVTPILRERGLKRNQITLLRVPLSPRSVATGPLDSDRR